MPLSPRHPAAGAWWAPTPLDSAKFCLTYTSGRSYGHDKRLRGAVCCVRASARMSYRPCVHVNVLWFTSLAMSMACALWVTLMQQWTRRYMHVAGRRYGPSKRARIRAFFAYGVEKFGLPAAVEVLPGLLHMSVLLFYVGLVDFLLTINHTVVGLSCDWMPDILHPHHPCHYFIPTHHTKPPFRHSVGLSWKQRLCWGSRFAGGRRPIRVHRIKISLIITQLSHYCVE
jgi:Family of unknown function (DUF6535)